MAEYELFVDVEFADRRGMQTSMGRGQNEIQPLKLEELKAKAANKEEVFVELRDPATLENFKARVIIATKPEDLPEADTLWLIRTSGRFSEPWAIKIIERVEEEEHEVKALPKRRLSLAERKGSILSELLKMREEKMKAEKEKGAQKE